VTGDPVAEVVKLLATCGFAVEPAGDRNPTTVVVCPRCAATLSVPATPWRPTLAARRLIAFALTHKAVMRS
jgi:hypothetical protein